MMTVIAVAGAALLVLVWLRRARAGSRPGRLMPEALVRVGFDEDEVGGGGAPARAANPRPDGRRRRAWGAEIESGAMSTCMGASKWRRRSEALTTPTD